MPVPSHIAVCCNSTYRLRYWNFFNRIPHFEFDYFAVATVLTVYGIETYIIQSNKLEDAEELLQQYLPFTVLKRVNIHTPDQHIALQQYLPFTVLKLNYN